MIRPVCTTYNRFFAVLAMLMIASPVASTAQALDDAAASIRSPEDLARWMSKEISYTMVLPDRARNPEETILSRVGDCDDLAMVASAMLTRMGIENKVLILKFRDLKIRHAICIWKDEGGLYSFISNRVLNRTGKYTIEEAVKRYYPDCETMTTVNLNMPCDSGSAGPSERAAQRSRTECAPMAIMDPQFYTSL